jgi:hypothetical protein
MEKTNINYNGLVYETVGTGCTYLSETHNLN